MSDDQHPDRPWRLEHQANPGDPWTIVSTYATEEHAYGDKFEATAEDPSVVLRVRKHVEFEAAE